MNYYRLRDCEKFKVMTEVYKDIFIDSKYFATKIGVGRATVFYWIKLEKELYSYETDKKKKDKKYGNKKLSNCSFNTKSKIKICQGFRLLDTVWSDTFSTEEDFEQRLLDYKKVEKESSIRIWTPLDKLKDTRDVREIEHLSIEEIDMLVTNRLENRSGSFMFAFAEKLKSQQRIKEALEVLTWIEKGNNTFKYTHENQIKHLKAILLSHNSIKDWNGAIDILRSLYHSSAYHLQEPEILTLLASNYKRKALDSANSKEEIDMDFLTSALCLYEDAMRLKVDNQKFYDAINLAYLYKIVDAIEFEYADKLELDILAKTVSDISNTEDWWEVSSKAEFAMLLGNVNIAITFVSGFLENHIANPLLYKVDDFKMSVFFRQLKLYIKFTDDIDAKRFFREIGESWKSIRVSESKKSNFVRL